ncbi:MAG: MbtH family NRPS accessory protein [Phormidesmis sp.]
MTPSPEPTYRVVISDEGRYSIWPDYKEIPWGWRADGKIGSKQTCLDYIAEVWTDMRPLSLQQTMAELQSSSHA